MSLRSVLVLTQVGVASLHRGQAHTYKLIKKTKSESVGKHNALSLFAVIFPFLFYYCKQIFFVVKIKVYIATCNNP